MLKHIFKTACLLLALTTLSACMSLGQLNYKQARMLKQEGFSLTSEGWSLSLPEKLLFGFDQAEIQAHNQQALQQLSSKLLKYKLDKVKIIGHSDNVGDLTYNLKLSGERAENVAQIFMQQGFRPVNLQVIPRGAEQPLVPNTSPENRAMNRRVNVVIVP
ncbi:OmpA family protein [Acinetobacter indicus]|uniref:OmpA family protein n=1 Tax=Acinetobacter indicus TaxID=756892 RepID=UPI0025750629|nr:OmpA family protein [Acinetobacter indicus]MDM1329380.1 OmpA family protein [Acinetobacter indicus]MDM1337779.1 OmpA family protein [Acinetobacter indicus]